MEEIRGMKRVIHIYGAAGSGTSTLGRYISEKSDYFFMDTDDYFWEPTNPPYTTKRNRSARIKLMKADIEKYDNVVIAGSLVGWGDELILLFTLAIRIKTDTSIRIDRLKIREREKYGSRIDIGGDMHDNHIEFINWAASYDNGGINMRSKAEHDKWQKQLLCPIIQVDGSIPVRDNYELIKEKYQFYLKEAL